jgi:hypothetical protein
MGEEKKSLYLWHVACVARPNVKLKMALWQALPQVWQVLWQVLWHLFVACLWHHATTQLEERQSNLNFYTVYPIFYLQTFC